MPNLEDLDLSCNKITTAGMKELFSSLNATYGLKTLMLHMCGLEQDGLCILGKKHTNTFSISSTHTDTNAHTQPCSIKMDTAKKIAPTKHKCYPFNVTYYINILFTKLLSMAQLQNISDIVVIGRVLEFVFKAVIFSAAP